MMKTFDIELFRSAPIPSQAEVICDWGNFVEPKVSIICLTYNQEDYIEDAIRGFLIQKTQFPFEIIVHDDASVDLTLSIVRLYQERYPRIIKIIAQTENQYSKSANSVLTIASTAARGEFFAFCEGDDFWIDPYKLTKQMAAAANYPNASLIVHNALTVFEATDRQVVFKPKVKGEKFSITDIFLERNQFAPTASYFVKAAVMSDMPPWFHAAPYGDFFIEAYSQKSGHGVFLSDLMSIYRFGAAGSWSKSSIGNRKKIISMHERLLELYGKMLLDFPAATRALGFRIKASYLEIIFHAVKVGENEKSFNAVKKMPHSIERLILLVTPRNFLGISISLINFSVKIFSKLKRIFA